MEKEFTFKKKIPRWMIRFKTTTLLHHHKEFGQCRKRVVIYLTTLNTIFWNAQKSVVWVEYVLGRTYIYMLLITCSWVCHLCGWTYCIAFSTRRHSHPLDNEENQIHIRFWSRTSSPASPGTSCTSDWSTMARECQTCTPRSPSGLYHPTPMQNQCDYIWLINNADYKCRHELVLYKDLI